MNKPNIVHRNRVQTTTAQIRERKQAREIAGSRKGATANREVRKEIASALTNPPERHLIGERGHWIEPRGIANDGREKFAIFSPHGELIAMRWGKDNAEIAIQQLIADGTMTT